MDTFQARTDTQVDNLKQQLGDLQLDDKSTKLVKVYACGDNCPFFKLFIKDKRKSNQTINKLEQDLKYQRRLYAQLHNQVNKLKKQANRVQCAYCSKRYTLQYFHRHKCRTQTYVVGATTVKTMKPLKQKNQQLASGSIVSLIKKFNRLHVEPEARLGFIE